MSGPGERPLPPSWDGSVVLDIGGEVGALVLRASPDLDGEEIDLRPDDPDTPHTHSAVRERRLPTGSMYAAVYPALTAGGYTVVGSTQRVEIHGGQVTEVDLIEDSWDHSARLHSHDGHLHSHAGGH
jgi:hypothetical protein